MKGRTKLLVGMAVMLVAIMGMVLPSALTTHAGTPTAFLNAASTAPVAALPSGQTVLGASPISSAVTALHWSTGQAYPTVNGKATPPPVPQQALPPTTGGHYYAGSVYAGSAVLNNWVMMEISIPAGAPSSSQFYYVILSIWDNGGSYDQIGFANDYGSFQIAYSYTTGTCAASYVYSASAGALTAGQEYLFAITTAPGSYTSGAWEEVYTVSATGGLSLIFGLHAPTGATAGDGLEQEAYYCGDYDYTDYEEVYGTTTYTQPDPYQAPYGFVWFFHENCNGASGCNAWTPWSAWHTSNAPGGTSVTIGKYAGVNEQVSVINKMTNKGFVTG